MSAVYEEGSPDCAHEWFNFHDGSDRLCEKCNRHELRPDSDSALLIAANAELHALRERVAALDEAVALMHRMGADDARDEWRQRVVLPELETDIDAFLVRRALTAPATPTNAETEA